MNLRERVMVATKIIAIIHKSDEGQPCGLMCRVLVCLWSQLAEAGLEVAAFVQYHGCRHNA